METVLQGIHQFIEYARTLRGDEKGEAQVFCDRLFQAFGHQGYKEAGATLEERVQSQGKPVKFADLVWRPRLLLEMKKRGEKLQNHYRQAFEYWLYLVPHRPRYVVLCNFDEFWIYDFNSQLDDPVDRVPLEALPERYTALNFLFPEDKKPLFGNNREAVTREAADKAAQVFNDLVARGENRELAQRFVLQCVVSMFAEDFGLLPRGLFSELIEECRSTANTYDLLGALFRHMNSPKAARGGRFTDVPYFNGGLFAVIEPIDCKPSEVKRLADAAQHDWSKVNPVIFGTLFQSSLEKKERHALGAHFTSEADIQKVVLATIVRPWRERIEKVGTVKDLLAAHQDLLQFRVLDPACGSGNFLFVAYREIKRIEIELLTRIQEKSRKKLPPQISLVGLKQFHGIDCNAFAVELAKVTLILAKELALAEMHEVLGQQLDLPFELEESLPLDNLDDTIRCNDALFCEWPKADAIIGNPPYQSKNKIQREYGPEYVARVRAKYPDVPGRADYCVYWFRRAHDELPPGGRAGLVGTNTISQNYSREGGLDYIVRNGGTITEAVSTQVWSGEAVVHVSIVNWIKGDFPGKKTLSTQLGDRADDPWQTVELDFINSALSATTDVTGAYQLNANIQADVCFQGQTQGHRSFLLSPSEAKQYVRESSKNADVLFPFLTGDNLLADPSSLPKRFVIDFYPRDVFNASQYLGPFNRVQKTVLPARQREAEREQKRNEDTLSSHPHARVNRHHQNFLKNWWHPSYPRPELLQILSTIPRYIACARVTKRPIFEFVHNSIRPSDALQVFTLPDDYSFGILQSDLHWQWFTGRCSTLKRDFRYTSITVFDTFPWPQSPTGPHIEKIAQAAVALRTLRRKIMAENKMTLRDLYRMLELPGHNPLRDAHENLDQAVRAAYGLADAADPLAFLLELNLELAAKEKNGEKIVGPGLPPNISDSKPYVTTDCVRMP